MVFAIPLSSFAQRSSTLLSGKPMGSINVDYGTGKESTTVNAPACAFDGDMQTFYASYDKSQTWVGLDLGSPHVITRVGWSPRNHSVGPGRVQLALFEGSNSPDFLDAVPLYLIPETGTIGVMHRANVSVSRGFRYVRYVGPNSARCNIAELEFWGYKDEGDDSHFYQLTNLPTLSIHIYNGTEPVDKENELESNITITYDNGTHIQEYPVLTRLRGNGTLGSAKKPYRIKFNDGKSHHMLKDSPQESPAKAKKWVLISNYGDKTLLRYNLGLEISRLMGMSYTAWHQPVDVILNGEYKGCYLLCDQITVDPNRVNITEMDSELKGGYMIEIDAYASREPELSHFTSPRNVPVTIKSPGKDDITAQQKAFIQNEFNLLENAVWSKNYTDEHEGYRKYLDVESFLRHFLIGEFTGNTDTYWSTYMYKDHDQQRYTVGPCWDFDLTFENDSRTRPINDKDDWVFRSGGSNAGNVAAMVSRILTDPYADSLMKAIWQEGRTNGPFREDILFHLIDSIAALIDASKELNFIRWPQLKKTETNPDPYQTALNVVRNYIPERIRWIDDYLARDNHLLWDSIYYIGTPEELIDFTRLTRQGISECSACLTADIDLTGYGNQFQPIGSKSVPFMGSFDGQNHRITGFEMTATSGMAGLFGKVINADIRNFSIDGHLVCAGASNGAIAFADASTITNVHSSLIIDVPNSGVTHTAGVLGECQNGCIVSRCSYTGILTVSSDNYDCFGGVCGYTNIALFENCANYGTIRFSRQDCYAGGVIGYINNKSCQGPHNCLNAGRVIYTGQGAPLYGGAIIGRLRSFSADLFGQNYWLSGSAPTGCGENTTNRMYRRTQQQMSSGEVCYLLNKDQAETAWYQTLGEDDFPVLDSTHLTVIQQNDKTYANGSAGTDVPDIGFNIQTGVSRPRTTDIFTLTGMRVYKPTRGIYIINGKRVLVK